ncbi:protein of unknown function [Methylacidimicrobium sp. AP8]|uniref:tetratricopeptide repeat protein n=1 Tax=Methylacidimicrobium sp. AP8 TaxID=2730359 RepID=UPI0018C14DB5|nr:SEL1-like repeat protein [Methylacidimicrobium sp. AP8]CAB4244178.1 protein of unknown function [Methylacidimicrobium sp. AP8]
MNPFPRPSALRGLLPPLGHRFGARFFCRLDAVAATAGPPSGGGEISSEDRQESERAAERGDAGAQYRLGAAHLEGLGFEPDREEAEAWLEKAAAQGEAEAKEELSQLEEKASRPSVR